MMRRGWRSVRCDNRVLFGQHKEVCSHIHQTVQRMEGDLDIPKSAISQSLYLEDEYTCELCPRMYNHQVLLVNDHRVMMCDEHARQYDFETEVFQWDPFHDELLLIRWTWERDYERN